MPLELRPHQVSAREAVEKELAVEGRATVVMPCATGKTLLQLVVANEYSRVLILEPSLALIRQTLQRARQENIVTGRALLCVCSDQGVAKDEWKVDEADLGIPVTTESSEIRVVLSGRERVLAFCTYQSLPLLAAGLPAGFEFDIGVFDECHRTAGTADKKFGAGLLDSNIAIRKRFFATATPKVFAFGGDPEEVRRPTHSMDNTDSYGRTVFAMSVRDAIEKGIICDYQVLVSATTEAMAQSALEKAGETMFPQSQTPVELVAAQLSVLKAIEVTGSRRVITYHSTIAEAQEFASDGLDLFRAAGVATFHIFGAMASSQRQAVIDAFLAHDGPAVITNARCLSEGVDVPAIDLVALMSKRESVVDVVQILGRALRPYPGKSTGYIMLPIFVDSEHAADQALAGSELAITWEILHSILETEDAPTEYQAIGSPTYGYQRGNYISGRGNLRVVAPEGLLQTLERGITVRPVSRLGYASEQMLEAARAFKAREGHLRVVVTHSEGPYKLGAWLKRMRRLRSLGRLNPSIEKALNELGMDFGGRARSADQYVRELSDFHQQTRHWKLPPKAPWGSLRSFVKKVRSKNKSGTLDPALREQLVAIGFPFDSDLTRTETLAIVASQVKSEGTVELAWKKLSATQKRWLRNRKLRKDQGRLSAEQQAAIVAAGIDLDNLPVERISVLDRLAGEAAFERNLEALKSYLGSAGSRLTFGKERHRGVQLAEFLKRCRREEANGTLPADRRNALDALGFDWRTSHRKKRNESSVRSHLETLAAFRQEHGHMRLPTTREYARVRNFVQSQRKNRSKLSPTRVAELEAVGFTWSFEEEAWEMYLAELKRHRSAGTQPAAASPLANYLRRLERLHRDGELDAEKRRALDDAGVAWARSEGLDIAMFARLARIAKKFGRVNVMSIAKREADLAQWLSLQIQALHDGTASPDLSTKLEKFGVRTTARIAKPASSQAR